MSSNENYDKQTIEYLLESDIFQNIDYVIEDWAEGKSSHNDSLELIRDWIDVYEDDNGKYGNILNDFVEQIDNILLAVDDEEISPEDAIEDIDELIVNFEGHELVKKDVEYDYSIETIETLDERGLGEEKQWEHIKKNLEQEKPLEAQQIQYFDEMIEEYKDILKKKRTWRINRIQKLQHDGIGEKSRWETMLNTLKINKELSSEDVNYFLIKSKEFRRGIISTTPSIQGYEIVSYLDIVSGHSVIGLNILKDSIIGLTDIFGGRSGIMERNLQKGKEIALKEMTGESKSIGANAVVSVKIDFSPVTRENNQMLMVSATGTAVIITPSKS